MDSEGLHPANRCWMMAAGGKKIPKVGGYGESPEQNISEVCIQKNEKIFCSSDIPLLKMPSVALQLRPPVSDC